MKAVPGLFPTLLEMICFFSTPTIDVEPIFMRLEKRDYSSPYILTMRVSLS